MSDNKITAVIPVRAGSRRLPNKNILPFADSNLLTNKIQQLKKVKAIDEIVVSSDSDVMLNIAYSENVTAQKRPVEYCDEKSKSFNEVVEWIANNINTDILMWTPCVCPIVDSTAYENAIYAFENKEPIYDSVVSALLLKEYIFDESGPVNFSIEKHVPSQELPNWHIITNGFFIAKRADMARWKFVYGKKPLLCEISKFEAIDIDDEADFKLSEYIFKNNLRS